MKIKELQNFLQNHKKGTFVKATWKSEKDINGTKCEKISNGVVRFVKYGNIKGVVVKGTNNGDTAIIENTLYQTSKGNLLVQMATTHIKAHSTYMVNGVEVDKATYETYVKPNNGVRVIFRVKLENLISLG